MRRRLTFLVVMAALWCAGTGVAAGHAVIERSNPPADTSLRTPPRQVTVWFTEPIDPGLSAVTTLDRAGKQVSTRWTVSADRRSITVPLPALTEGIYVVRWRVLSTVDGHTTSGAFLFAVGVAIKPGEPSSDAVALDPWLVAVRWLGLLAAMVLAGGIFFEVAVLRPALARLPAAQREHLALSAASRLHRITVVSGLIFVAGAAGQIALQGRLLLDLSLWQLVASRAFWTLVTETRLGWAALAQLSMAALLLLPQSSRGRIIQAGALVFVLGVAGLAVLFRGLGALTSSIHLLHLALIVVAALGYGFLQVVRRPAGTAWVQITAAVGLLGGFTIASHAAGSGIIAGIADWLHLLAAALWTGGLPLLWLTLYRAGRQDRAALAQVLLPRFSAAAAFGLGVLVVTGSYSAWVHVPSLQALTITPYGRTLLIKLALVAPLAALGAVNRFIVRPRLEAAQPNPTFVRRLLQFAGGEVLLAASVLLAVSALTVTPPARVALTASQTARAGLQLAGLADDVRVELTLTPGLPGWNRFEVVVTGPERASALEGARVLIRPIKLDEPLDPTLIRLQPGAGRHAAEGSELAIPGWWELEVIVRRRGRPDAVTSFPLRLGTPPQRASTTPAAERLLDDAREAARAVRTWRERQQLADGKGGVAFTWFEFVAPNRLRYRVPDGTEAVVIGATRYLRTGAGPWERGTLSQALRAEGPLLYLQDARAAGLGRRGACDDEMCRVVLWEWDARTAFAAWIGERSHRVHRLFMLAPSHYMTIWYGDFNAPIRIEPP